jgi:succinoglycan biosynthesis protein ExoM
MTPEIKHISVCICTFKRPALLRRLLNKLDRQHTDGLFTYSVVVVDNDCCTSAKPTVQSFREESKLDVQYYIEPEQNIALARNRAIENAKGNLIAFIDDDEFPGSTWLLRLFNALRKFKVDGILGPVEPRYEDRPPKWVVQGKFYEKPWHKTGFVLQWQNTRTSNVLLQQSVFSDRENRFDPAFGRGGEDKDFFRRMINKRYVFAWCNEATVFEAIPPERCTRSFMLKRALLRGRIPYNQVFSARLKSLFALPVYTVLLPFLFLVRHSVFMKYLIKYFDHIGRVLAWMGFDLIKEKYVTK